MNKLLKMYMCLFNDFQLILNKSCDCFISYTGDRDHLKEAECRKREGEERKGKGERGREMGESGEG